MVKRYVSTEDTGVLNSFAIEPKMYRVEANSDADKRNYMLIAVGSSVLVGGLIAFSVFASNIS